MGIFRVLQKNYIYFISILGFGFLYFFNLLKQLLLLLLILTMQGYMKRKKTNFYWFIGSFVPCFARSIVATNFLFIVVQKSLSRNNVKTQIDNQRCNWHILKMKRRKNKIVSHQWIERNDTNRNTNTTEIFLVWWSLAFVVLALAILTWTNKWSTIVPSFRALNVKTGTTTTANAYANANHVSCWIFFILTHCSG